jgi:hypothetical protein
MLRRPPCAAASRCSPLRASSPGQANPGRQGTQLVPIADLYPAPLLEWHERAGLAPRDARRDARAKETPVHADYDRRQIVGIDLHRRRSVVVWITETGDRWPRCASPTTRPR